MVVLTYDVAFVIGIFGILVVNQFALGFFPGRVGNALMNDHAVRSAGETRIRSGSNHLRKLCRGRVGDEGSVVETFLSINDSVVTDVGSRNLKMENHLSKPGNAFDVPVNELRAFHIGLVTRRGHEVGEGGRGSGVEFRFHLVVQI